MKKELAEKIVEAMEVEGEFAEVYEGYSGRRMYGKETYGVECESESALITAIIANDIKASL